MLSPNLEPLCVTGPAAGDPVDHGQGGFPTSSFDHSQAGFAPDLVLPPGGIRAEAGADQLASVGEGVGLFGAKLARPLHESRARGQLITIE